MHGMRLLFNSMSEINSLGLNLLSALRNGRRCLLFNCSNILSSTSFYVGLMLQDDLLSSLLDLCNYLGCLQLSDQIPIFNDLCWSRPYRKHLVVLNMIENHGISG